MSRFDELYSRSLYARKASKKDIFEMLQNTVDSSGDAGCTLSDEDTVTLLAFFTPPLPKRITNAIDWVARAVSTDEYRPHLSQIWYDHAEGVIVATSGHRLHMASHSASPEVIAMAKDPVRLGAYITRFANLWTDGPVYTFPNYRKVIPADFADPVEVDLSTLPVSAGGKGFPDIVTMPGGVRFNRQYIVDALGSTMRGMYYANVKGGPDKLVPHKFVPSDHPTFTAIVMPVR